MNKIIFFAYSKRENVWLGEIYIHWITIILIGIAANLDNLGISLAYGIKQIKIPILSNITIAIISMVLTYFSVVCGKLVTEYIPVFHANFWGSLLLCIIGIWTILSSKFSNGNSSAKSERVDKDGNNIISIGESVTLGFILSINCFVSGIGIGANGISVIWTVLSIGLFSVLSVGIGSRFGLLLLKTFIGKYSTAISGYLLIGIGIYEMFA